MATAIIDGITTRYERLASSVRRWVGTKSDVTP
jgi:hypothetical protein